MNRNIQRVGTVAVALLLTGTLVAGHGHHATCPKCQHTGPCGYKEVVVQRCRQVPDKKTKKKVVYECKEIPYCEHALGGFLHKDCCPKCEECPRYKRVLRKKEVVEEEVCGTKCVVEDVVIRVPCCGHCQCPCSDGDEIHDAELGSEPAPVPPPETPADTKVKKTSAKIPAKPAILDYWRK